MLARVMGWAVLVTVAGPGAAAAETPASVKALPAVDPALVAQFEQRIEAYVKLREEAEEGLPTLEEGASPVAIAAHQEVLGQKIVRLRTGARQGDLLFPELAQDVREMVRRELSRSPAARDAVRDTNPRTETPRERVPLRVNAVYTPGASISSVPPNVLLRLPALPADVLEYSFVGDALVLRDMVANIVVDFVTGVVP